jgi:hypothetical protein
VTWFNCDLQNPGMASKNFPSASSLSMASKVYSMIMPSISDDSSEAFSLICVHLPSTKLKL